MLRLRADVVDGVLRNVQLSGDFFLMPSETLTKLEAALEQQEASANIALLLDRILENEGATLVGISTKDIEEAVRSL